jgi:hypothetical protein
MVTKYAGNELPAMVAGSINFASFYFFKTRKAGLEIYLEDVNN